MLRSILMGRKFDEKYNDMHDMHDIYLIYFILQSVKYKGFMKYIKLNQNLSLLSLGAPSYII